MIAIRTAGVCIAAGLLVGCQTREQPRPVERGPAPIQAAESLRATLMRANPDAQVGIVAAALPDAQLVAVRDVPAEQFEVGSTVQFVDVDRNPVGQGSVVMIKNGAVHVRYDAAGGRAPQVGDLALRVAGSATNAGSQAPAMEPAPGETPAAAPMEADPAASEPAGAEPTRLPPRRGAVAPAAETRTPIAEPAQPEAQPEAAPAQPEAQPEAAPAEAAPAEPAPGEPAPAEAAPEAAPADAQPTPGAASDAAPAPADAPAADEKPADAPAPGADKPDQNK